MRAEREGDAAAWLAEALVAPSGQGHTASAAEVMALLQSYFESLVAGDQKASLLSFSIAPPIQAHRGPLPLP